VGTAVAVGRDVGASIIEVSVGVEIFSTGAHPEIISKISAHIALRTDIILSIILLITTLVVFYSK
jgi:hypothetical protein